MLTDHGQLSIKRHMYDHSERSDKRTARIVHALAEAVLRLLSQTGWDGLTVSKICDEADVARSTFYLHFRSPDDVIYEGLRTAYLSEFPEIDSSSSSLDPDSLLAHGKPLSYPFFAHLARHSDTYRAIFSDDRGAGVAKRILRDVATVSKTQHAGLRALSTNPLDPDLTAAYLAGALMASGTHWVLTGMEKSALEMAYWFSSMAAPGLLDIMGLSEMDGDE